MADAETLWDRTTSVKPAASTVATHHACRIRVYNAASHEAINGAIVLSDYSKRVIPRNSVQALGRTNDMGEVTIAFSELESLRRLGIAAPAFIPFELDVTALADGEESVALDPGYALDVECLDQDDTPVPRCTVLLSTVQPCRLGDHFEPNDSIAGFREDRIYTSQSDALGIASLRGLATAEYELWASREGYAVLRIEKAGGESLVVPYAGSVVVRLAPLVAAVYEVKDDIMLTWLHDIPFFPASTTPLASLTRERARLEAAFPSAVVEVFPSPPNQSRAVQLPVQAVLQHGGFTAFTVPALPIDQIGGPVIVEQGARLEDMLAYESIVTIKDGSGRSVDSRAFKLVFRPGRPAIEIPLRNGNQPLPTGTWRIRCVDPRLMSRFTPSEVSIPGDLTIEVHCALRLCLLKATDELGNSYQEFSVAVHAAGRTTLHYAIGGEPLEMWLPVGTASFETMIYGLPVNTTSVEVLQSDSTQIIQLVPTE